MLMGNKGPRTKKSLTPYPTSKQRNNKILLLHTFNHIYYFPFTNVEGRVADDDDDDDDDTSTFSFLPTILPKNKIETQLHIQLFTRRRGTSNHFKYAPTTPIEARDA